MAQITDQFIFKVVVTARPHQEINVYEIMPDGGAMLISPCESFMGTAELMSNYVHIQTKLLEGQNDSTTDGGSSSKNNHDH